MEVRLIDMKKRRPLLALVMRPGYRTYQAIDNKMMNSKYKTEYIQGKKEGEAFINKLFNFSFQRKKKLISKSPMQPLKPNRAQRRGNAVMQKKQKPKFV